MYRGRNSSEEFHRNSIAMSGSSKHTQLNTRVGMMSHMAFPLHNKSCLIAWPQPRTRTEQRKAKRKSKREQCDRQETPCKHVLTQDSEPDSSHHDTSVTTTRAEQALPATMNKAPPQLHEGCKSGNTQNWEQVVVRQHIPHCLFAPRLTSR